MVSHMCNVQCIYCVLSFSTSQHVTSCRDLYCGSPVRAVTWGRKCHAASIFSSSHMNTFQPHKLLPVTRVPQLGHYSQYLARSFVSDEHFHFHFWSWRDMRITHVATVAPPKWAEVAVHHTRPASTNTQLSSAAS